MMLNELIYNIFKMFVDLFWNGGIGIYIKSKKEFYFDVGDCVNDDLWVNG